MHARKNSHHFSVVLPLYKPTGNWVDLFLQNVEELNNLIPDDVMINYIIVYDGFPEPPVYESIQSILRQVDNIDFISYPANRGKGYALRQGIKAAVGDYILITDFDFPYRKKNIVELINLLKNGYDVVVGRRSKSYFNQLPFRRKVISGLCNLLKKIFLNLPVYDTQSGIKAFNKNGKDVFLETEINRFLIDTEFILRSYKQNLSIRQIDIELESYVKFSRFGFRVIREEMKNFLKLLYLNKKMKRTAVCAVPINCIS